MWLPLLHCHRWCVTTLHRGIPSFQSRPTIGQQLRVLWRRLHSNQLGHISSYKNDDNDGGGAKSQRYLSALSGRRAQGFTHLAKSGKMES